MKLINRYHRHRTLTDAEEVQSGKVSSFLELQNLFLWFKNSNLYRFTGQVLVQL